MRPDDDDDDDSGDNEDYYLRLIALVEEVRTSYLLVSFEMALPLQIRRQMASEASHGVHSSNLLNACWGYSKNHAGSN